MQGGCAIVQTDAVTDAEVVGEMPLEAGHGWAEDKLSLVEHRLQRRLNGRPHGAVTAP